MSHLSRLVLVTLAALVAVSPGLPAETAADLFDPAVLHEIRISISSRDLGQLRERYQENIYFPADIQWHGVKVRNAAVRSRGRTTRSDIKLGLQIEFDRYTSGQRLLGLRGLVLDNLWQDPAMLRERVTMAFFERMGEPAPRESFARVFINGAYEGLYAVVEPIDDMFLARAFGESSGYLFEYKLLSLFRGEYLGDGLEPYKVLFEPRTRQLEADSTLYSPIRDLFREVNHEEDAVWRERVEQYVHLSQFVTYVAIEMFMAEEDGILGPSGMSNFYLYREAGSNVHRLIPWDKDLAFARPDKPIMERAEENELFRRALGQPDLRDLYRQTLAACARAAVTDSWLLREVSAGADLVAEAAYADTGKPVTNEQFDAAIADLKAFARSRPRYVLQELGLARR